MATDPLTEPILAYLKELAADFRRSNVPVYLFESSEWMKLPDGGARRTTITHPHLGPFLHYHKERASLYAPAVAAICQDKDFGPSIGSMVGGEGGLTRLESDSVISHAASNLAKADGTVSVMKAEVSRRLAQLRRYLTQKHVSDTLIIPLPGIKSYRFPFVIEDGIEIDVLTDEEIGACVGSGMLRPLSEDFPFLSPEECVGARVEVKSTRLIVKPEELAETQEKWIDHLNEQSTTSHKF